MKKFLLNVLFAVCIFTANAQFVESFNSGSLPAGWDIAQGIQVSPYNNPSAACANDFGLQTPGVGGNNPSNVLTAISTFSTSASFINVGFTIYIFDANMNCSSAKNLPCATFVKVYLVKGTWSTAAVPPASEILAESQVQIVQSNTANILYVPTPGLPNGTSYRVLYDFTVDGNCNQQNTKYVLDDFRVVTTIPGPLPVTLKSFEAIQKPGKITLVWNTILELDNDGYEIERRIGGGAYQKIAFVDSKAPGGNGAAYEYSFDDVSVLPKAVTYYRLKQVDLNGRVAYSEIRSVRTGSAAILLSVYPNPSRGTTNVAIPAGIGTIDVSLTDFTGRSLQQWNGINTSSLQLKDLGAGMYMLRVSIRATGETITERIAVQ